MVRIFRGGVLDERFEGSVVVIGPRPTTMTGLVRGDLFVRDNSVCDVTGMVSGNLLAERTGKAVLHGLVMKAAKAAGGDLERSEEHTSELQSQSNLVCRLLL